MTPSLLSAALGACLDRLRERGELPVADLHAEPEDLVVSVYRGPGEGDYSSPVALRLADHAQIPASRLASLLAAELEHEPEVADVLVSGPGFLTIRLRPGAQGALVRRIVLEGAAYGQASPIGRPHLLHSGAGVPAVQYAHSRAVGLLRGARRLGILGPTEQDERDLALLADPRLLCHPRETDLLKLLALYPEVAEAAARRDEASPLVTHLSDLANAFLRVHESCDILPRGGEDVVPVHLARLLATASTRVVLASGLTLLGADAPELM